MLRRLADLTHFHHEPNENATVERLENTRSTLSISPPTVSPMQKPPPISPGLQKKNDTLLFPRGVVFSGDHHRHLNQVFQDPRLKDCYWYRVRETSLDNTNRDNRYRITPITPKGEEKDEISPSDLGYNQSDIDDLNNSDLYYLNSALDGRTPSQSTSKFVEYLYGKNTVRLQPGYQENQEIYKSLTDSLPHPFRPTHEAVIFRLRNDTIKVAQQGYRSWEIARESKAYNLCDERIKSNEETTRHCVHHLLNDAFKVDHRTGMEILNEISSSLPYAPHGQTTKMHDVFNDLFHYICNKQLNETLPENVLSIFLRDMNRKNPNDNDICGDEYEADGQARKKNVSSLQSQCYNNLLQLHANRKFRLPLETKPDSSIKQEGGALLDYVAELGEKARNYAESNGISLTPQFKAFQHEVQGLHSLIANHGSEVRSWLAKSDVGLRTPTEKQQQYDNRLEAVSRIAQLHGELLSGALNPNVSLSDLTEAPTWMRKIFPSEPRGTSVSVYPDDTGDKKIIYDDLSTRGFSDTGDGYNLKKFGADWQVAVRGTYQNAGFLTENVARTERLRTSSIPPSITLDFSNNRFQDKAKFFRLLKKLPEAASTVTIDNATVPRNDSSLKRYLRQGKGPTLIHDGEQLERQKSWAWKIAKGPFRTPNREATRETAPHEKFSKKIQNFFKDLSRSSR